MSSKEATLTDYPKGRPSAQGAGNEVNDGSQGVLVAEDDLQTLYAELRDLGESLAVAQDAVDSLQSSPFGVVRLDRAGAIEAMNASARTLLRLEGSSGSRSLSSLVHPDAKAAHAQAWLAAQDGRSSTVDLLFAPDNSDSVTLEVTFQPMADRTMLWLADKSEQRAIESALVAAQQPGRQVFHELANHFAVAAGFADLIHMNITGLQTEESRRQLAAQVGQLRDGLATCRQTIEGGRGRASRSPRQAPTSSHFIVVNDDAAEMAVIEELLTQRGLQVSTFTDSRAALAFFGRQTDGVDGVVVDEQMPHMGGIALGTEMMALRLDLQIILLSGNPDTVAAQQRGEINIKHLLPKPLDFDALNHAVDAVLRELRGVR
jgi:CheY-like chemotaxis protein/PAS domain-containing protein